MQLPTKSAHHDLYDDYSSNFRRQIARLKTQSKHNGRVSELETDESMAMSSIYGKSTFLDNRPSMQTNDLLACTNSVTSSQIEPGILSATYETPKKRMKSESILPSNVNNYRSSVDRSSVYKCAVQQNYYKICQSGTKTSSISNLKKKSVDLLRRSMKAFEEIQQEGDMDAIGYELSNLGAVKGSLYQKKVLKFEYSKQLKLSSQKSKAKTEELLSRLNKNNVCFNKQLKSHEHPVNYDFKPDVLDDSFKKINPCPLGMSLQLSSVDILRDFRASLNSQKTEQLRLSLSAIHRTLEEPKNPQTTTLNPSKAKQSVCFQPHIAKPDIDIRIMVKFVGKIHQLFKLKCFAALKIFSETNATKHALSEKRLLSYERTLVWDLAQKFTLQNEESAKSSKKPNIKPLAHSIYLTSNVSLTETLKSVKTDGIGQRTIFKPDKVDRKRVTFHEVKIFMYK